MKGEEDKPLQAKTKDQEAESSTESSNSTLKTKLTDEGKQQAQKPCPEEDNTLKTKDHVLSRPVSLTLLTLQYPLLHWLTSACLWSKPDYCSPSFVLY